MKIIYKGDRKTKTQYNMINLLSNWWFTSPMGIILTILIAIYIMVAIGGFIKITWDYLMDWEDFSTFIELEFLAVLFLSVWPISVPMLLLFDNDKDEDDDDEDEEDDDEEEDIQ